MDKKNLPYTLDQPRSPAGDGPLHNDTPAGGARSQRVTNQPIVRSRELSRHDSLAAVRGHTGAWSATVATLAATLNLSLPAASQTSQPETLRLPSPMFPEAIERWRQGAPDDALAILDRQLAPRNEDQPVEALVLRATLRREAGQPTRAEPLWRAVVEREIFMRTFARRALVESLTARGAVSDAAAVLTELTRGNSTRHLDLVLRVADGYAETGRPGQARALYETLVARQSRGELADRARLGISATLEADGRIDAAIQKLRETQLHHRTADTFESARRAERRLKAARGLPLTPWTSTQYRTLARRLRTESRHDTALTMIGEWRTFHGDDNSGVAAGIEAERIETLYSQRANDAAVAACQAFYRRFPGGGHGPDVRLTEFRLAVRMIDTDRARRLGLNLWEGRVPGATANHRWNAGNLLAAHLVAVGDLDGGLALYRQLFPLAGSADRQREILWRAGVAALRAGHTDRAVTNLQSLVNRNPTGDLLPAGLYWLAIAQSEASTEQSDRRLRDVIDRFPFHYYAMRAREALARQGGVVPDIDVDTTNAFPDITLSATTIGRAEYRASMVLARAGLPVDAAWYLRRLLERQGSDRGLALLAARASGTAGDYRSVTRILVNHFGGFLYQPAAGLPPDFWTLVYPRPFQRDIDHWARTHEVNPLLMNSLMRRESRFDPAARSAVGAVGLFQIMPYTAKALGERAGVSDIITNRTDDATLMRPSVNAAIAARLTADLLQLFDGAVAPVVASYNAGEERVAAWWDAARDLPEAFFVDTIPYSETRRFVREVLTNRAAYERLYGER